MSRQNTHMTVALAFLALATMLVGAIFYFLFLEKSYLSYHNIPFPALVKRVHPGDVIPLSVERCNTDKVQHNYVTSHSLEEVDRHEYVLLPEVQISIPPGCTTAVSLINKIPDSMPFGRYRVIGTAQARGTLRSHFVDWHSEPFDVVAR